MKGIRQTREDNIFDAIVLFVLIIAVLITLYPLIFVVSASVSSPQMVLQGKIWLLPKELTLEAYKAVFNDSAIMTGYKNTILYTLVGTAINLVMTVAGAFPLSRKDFYGRNIITMFLTVTMFFSGGMIPTYLLIKDLHLLNTFWVMVLPGAVGMWNLVIVKNFFQNSIPNELIEAANADGCTNVGTLLRIVIPLSKPILAVMIIFYGVGHWNAFFDALLYISNKSKYPLQLVLRQVLLKSEMNNMTGGSSDSVGQQQLLVESLRYAIIVVASLPVLMLYPFLQKYFVQGIMVGSIKG